MAEPPDPGRLLTALTTEHFTLQGARSQTMSESASRTTLYIGAVSSTLVALGFIGQVSEVGDAFDVFALTVLPTLYVLGAFTFIRVVECGAEDFSYGLAINRIRGYYRQLAGDQANLFLLSGRDDGRGVFENMGVPAYLVDNAADLRPEWIQGKRRVGITASAAEKVVKNAAASKDLAKDVGGIMEST
jgi:hypothetical protein